MQRLAMVHPVFLVAGIQRAAEFYRDVLGFSFDRYWGEPPCFVMVVRDEVEFFLRQAASPDQVRPNHESLGEPVWDAFVRVNDADALCEEFRRRGARITREPETTSYEMREFEVEDADGYVICFAHDTTQG